MQRKKKIHFIGIGGIGVSALAGYYLSRGHQISGSDLSQTATTDALEKQGVVIYIGLHRAQNIKKDVDLVVHTAAATKDNSELKKAKKLGIKTQLYAQALGDLTKQMFTIAVSGMHGKSTTTAMLALVLEKAGLDPTVIVGTKLREWGNMNYRVSRSKYLIIEADEYKASFLNYWPKIIVLTNIEKEHLDFYKDLSHIKATFKEYIGHLGKSGMLIANGQDKNVVELLNFQFSIFNFQTNFKFQITNFKQNVRFYFAEQRLSSVPKLSLKVPGKHNISNAMAVLAVARELKISDKTTFKALSEFSGTWRRMEFRGEINGAKIYDDYGHHPTEIKATLQGARELFDFPLLQRGIFAKGGSASGGKGDLTGDKIYRTPPLQKEGGKLYCVFQPHQYQRTYKLFDQFISAFNDADKIIILPIYSVPGREKGSIKKKVNSEMLVKAIKDFYAKILRHGLRPCSGGKILCPERSRKVLYINSFQKAKNYLKKNLKKGDVAIIMGAGDVNKLTEMLLDKP